MFPKPIPPLKVLKHTPSLNRAAQEEIKSFIIQHSLKPGDSLPPEGELAQQLNISRNSVREAVKSLEALGILEARPGSGLFVREFSFDSILDNLGYGILFDLKRLDDILEVRSHIECAMVERVIQAVTSEQLTALNEILNRMHQVAVDGKYSASDDRAFHQVLYGNIDNRLVRKIVDIFWVAFYQAQQRASIPGPADPLDTFNRHAEIVQAMEKRDVAQMRLVMSRHFTGILARLQKSQATPNRQPIAFEK